MAIKAACPRLNCPVLNMSVKPMAAMAQMPLDMNTERVMTFVVKTGRITIRKTNTPATVLGKTVL